MKNLMTEKEFYWELRKKYGPGPMFTAHSKGELILSKPVFYLSLLTTVKLHSYIPFSYKGIKIYVTSTKV